MPALFLAACVFFSHVCVSVLVLLFFLGRWTGRQRRCQRVVLLFYMYIFFGECLLSPGPAACRRGSLSFCVFVCVLALRVRVCMCARWMCELVLFGGVLQGIEQIRWLLVDAQLGQRSVL